MTLNVLDENGKIINDNNPLIIEHNGTTGGTVTLHLTLVNSSSEHYYKMVSIGVKSISPIRAGLLLEGEVVPYYMLVKKINRLYPEGVVAFNLQTSIPVNTSERVIKSMVLDVSGMRYPVPY